MEGKCLGIIARLCDYILIYICLIDLATIVPYDEGDLAQPQISAGTLYHRWSIDINFSKSGSIDGVNITVCELSSAVFCTSCSQTT